MRRATGRPTFQSSDRPHGGASQRGRHAERGSDARHDRADPRAVDDPTKLGALEGALREPRVHGARTCVAGDGGRGRGAERRPRPGRRARHRADRGPLREDRQEPRPRTGDHGPLLRWRVHPDPARSRTRRGRRRRVLRDGEGHPRPALVDDQVGRSGIAEVEGQGGRADGEGVPLRVRQHALGRGIERDLRAIRPRGRRPSSHGARSPTSIASHRRKSNSPGRAAPRCC